MRWGKALLLVLPLAAFLAAMGYRRAGLLGLPPVPDGLTAAEAGLAGLRESFARPVALPAGDGRERIARLEEAVRRDPADLALGNRLRMEVFRRKREWLAAAADRGEFASTPPPPLRDAPIPFFERLAAASPRREPRLQLALAHLDQMLLFPSLETQAAASLAATAILDRLLEREPAYVPALYARGMIFLHRPSGLVRSRIYDVPEDAASRDLALCVAVGRKLLPRQGTEKVAAGFALALGDAYAKEGRLGRGRSWWQIAGNLDRRPDFRRCVAARMSWPDGQVLERLEAVLLEDFQDPSRPMTDMEAFWR